MSAAAPHAALLVLALVAGTPAHAQHLVVVNKDVSTATVHALGDPTQPAVVLPTGSGPHEVAVSADGRWAVVTDYGPQGPGGTTLTVIALPQATIARTITVPYVRPHGAVFLPDNRTVLVTAERDARVVEVDVTTGAVRREHATGQRTSHMVALSPDARTAYTANITDGTLSIIPLSGGAPTIVPVGPMTEPIAAAPDGRTVWLGSNTTGKVFVVDVARRVVIDSVQTPGFPYRIGFTPDSRTAIVTNPESAEVRLIDVTSRAITAVISTGPGSQPFGIAVAPDGATAWITLRGTGEVAAIDLHSATLSGIITNGAGTGPDGIAFVP
jgi:DNA-binding beta-propeller fold protein YncE